MHWESHGAKSARLRDSRAVRAIYIVFGSDSSKSTIFGIDAA